MLPERWSASWRSAPENALLRTGGVGGTWLSAGELELATRRAARGLALAGVRQGDRVLWEADATEDVIIAALAVLRLGAILAPVSSRQSDLERATVLENLEPKLVVSEASRGAVSQKWRRASELSTPDAAVLGDLELDKAAPSDLALIVYTSGTTGDPKGAMLTHANLAAGVDSLQEAWGWTPEDRLLTALPLFHVHGLVVGLLTSLAIGSGTIVEASFDAGRFLAAIAEERATMSFCVPTMLHRIAEHPEASSVATLRLLVSGSAPLPAALFDRFADDLKTTILERYGMTETLLTISNPLDGVRRAGTVGFPLPGVSARIPEPGGPEEELWVAGPTVFAGYWRNQPATDAVMTDGWIATGDIIKVLSTGHIVICGRSRELIISGGFNVFPVEVEDVLRRQPGVLDACVVGSPSDEWGEEVVAHLVVTEDFDEALLLAALSGEISHYKLPRRIHVVDELPRNALGKLQRHLL